jgi:uncharacterized repeat protein (TIGR01451 family)
MNTNRKSLAPVCFLSCLLVAPAPATPLSLLEQAFPGVPAQFLVLPGAKDFVPLTIVSARTWGNPNGVEVVYSAPVAVSTATNAANYTVSPGISVTRAVMGADEYTVKLTTTTIPTPGLHTLTVNNVQDQSAPPNVIAANSRAPIIKAQGWMTRQIWTGIGGSLLNSLTNDVRFPNSPTGADFRSSLEAPSNLGDSYGTRMAGWLYPPMTGEYQFYLASDGEGRFYLSSDEQSANRVAIASVATATSSARQWNQFATQRSAYVYLEAGRGYYLEALQGESTGNDWLAVTWRMRGMPAPADGDAPIPGAFLSSLAASGPVSVTVPPQNLAVSERQPAAFSAVAAGTPSYAYQWRRHGFPIPGATGTNYVVASTAMADHGAQFSVVVSNAFSAVTSSVATLSVLADTTPPAVARLSGGPTMDKVILAFSEPLASSGANNAANYRFNGGLSTLDARLLPDGTNVVLTTSPQNGGTVYSLTITGVTDTASSPNPINRTTNFTAWTLCRGFVHRDAWFNLGTGSGALADLTGNPRFPDLPDAMNEVGALEDPSNVADGYGTRLVGILRAPVTGFYVFYIAADDQGQFWLSTDASVANKRLLCSEPVYNAARYWIGTDRRNAANPENVSPPVFLTAGQRYYFEALQRESYGGDCLGVTWQLPGAPQPVNGDPPIAASFLECYANPVGASLVITQQPLSVTVMESTVTNFSLSVTSSYSPVFYQWQRNGVDIAGATDASYTTPRLLRTDSGAAFRCLVAIPGLCLTSAVATLTVTPDNTAPQVVSAATLVASTNLGVCFNELLDTASATNPANYTLNIGGKVTAARLRPDGQSVALSVTAVSYTNYTLRLNNLKDYAGNALPANIVVPVVVVPLEASDIGIPGDPLEPGSTFVCNATNYDTVAGGSDIWNTRDGFHYLYETREGNFDARVRIARLDLKNQYTFAGLVVRENLTPGSRNLRIHLFNTNGANGYHASTRAAQDGTTVQTMSICCGPVPYPNAWLRLTRTNDTFTGWRGTNGVDWTPFVTMSMSFTGRVHLGMAACPVNNAAGQATTAWFRDFFASPAANPTLALDLLVKKATDPGSAYKLNGVYQSVPDTNQTLTLPASPTTPAAWHVQVQNDGVLAQDVRLRASEDTATGWTLTYLNAALDVTTAITSSNGYTLSNLAAGASVTLAIEARPSDRVYGGTPKRVVVQAMLPNPPLSVRDSVRLTALAEVNYQPDLAVRRMNDVLYAGEGIYNLTASNQTKTLRTGPCGGGVFALKLSNPGNVTNTFRLLAPLAAEGWSTRWFDDLVSSNDISADITSDGIYVSLVPGAAFDFRAEVASAGVVTTSNSLLLTARSLLNTNRADAVRLVALGPLVTNIPQTNVYTLDADFEQGVLAGTTYGGNQLTISTQVVTQPFIWVPNSNEGTVSKVNTYTGREIARYRTAPPSVTAQPSRTTVDQYGNCYVGNRQCGTVVKLGLLENGEFIDRNGNGVPDTSQDLNHDGDITGAELLAWGADECVLYEVVVIPGKEGVFVPGTYAGGYANDYWNPGPRSLAVDYAGNVWAGCYGTLKFYYLNGTTGQMLRTNDFTSLDHHPYGAIVDSYGVIWSSGYHETVSRNNVLRFDPGSGSASNVISGRRVYGLAMDRDNHLFVTGGDSHILTRYNVLTNGPELLAYDPGSWTKGAACTPDGDVWVANENDDNASRFSPDGVRKVVLPIGDGPTGAAVDVAGKVWIVDRYEETIRRINPANDTIDLTKRIVGGTHYGYSDMTGVIVRNTTARFGTWTVLNDTGVEFTPWGQLTWNALDPAGDGIRIRVRSSNDCSRWSTWERATNGVDLVNTPPGRYLQVDVALTCRVHDQAPVLYDLTVTPLAQRSANLSITQMVTPNPATNKTAVTWTITATNRGPQDARGVWVTNDLPTGVTLTGLSNSLGTVVQTSPSIRVNLGNLPAGSNFTLTAVATLHTIGTLTNIAGIAHYEKETAPADNVSVLTALATAIPCIAAPGNLSAWWPGDDSLEDLLGTNTAANVSGVTFTNGKVGRAFQFNGTSYLRVPASPTTHVGLSASGFSFELWVKPEDVSGAHNIVEWYGNGSPWAVHFWVSGWNAGAGNLGVAIPEINGTYHSVVSTPGKLVAGVWQHVAVTYDRTSGQATIYLNATSIVTGNIGKFAVNTATDFQIGARPSETCCYFRGAMDELSLYTRPLSVAELQAIYNAGIYGKCEESAMPLLRIEALSGINLALSWTAAAPTYQLYYASTPLGPWQPLGATPVLAGDRFVVPVSATTSARFYRLGRP